eukprot:Em0113g16a
MGGTSVSQLQYDCMITPLVRVATDPYESDQSELSLTLLRTPIVRGGGKDSEVPTKETQLRKRASKGTSTVGVEDVSKVTRSSKSRENVRGAKGTIRLTQYGQSGDPLSSVWTMTSPSELCRHLTKHGYLQSNEEEEFLQQVADVLQKTKLEKKKPSPKLQAQDTKASTTIRIGPS